MERLGKKGFGECEKGKNEEKKTKEIADPLVFIYPLEVCFGKR